jgi:TonB family protein
VLMAAMSRPKLSDVPRDAASSSTAPSAPSEVKHDSLEDSVFGSKKFYSMILNMPNLTSAGGSWIIRFAELSDTTRPGELTAPVAVVKVDPAYPSEAIRNKVEGVVVLYAVIRSDGTVGEVRVLRGVDQQLDANACEALSHWHFRPATKNGEAVDLESVVQIPFAIPRQPAF